MGKTLIRSVHLDGVHLAPGTELTDEQAKRITNPHATEDLSIKGQDGKSTGDTETESGANSVTAVDPGDGDGAVSARKTAAAKAAR